MISRVIRMQQIKCREKQLPHYFGRLVHAFDIFGYNFNEGNWLLQVK